MEPKVKIFLVEDEPVVQDVLKRLFRPRGYKVKTADRGDTALSALESNADYDLIITDLNLPGVSGIDVIKRAKALCPEVPVVLITAFASIDSAVAAMKAGAFDYIPKPFNNEQVLMVVDKALEQKRLLQENRRLRQALNNRYGFENLVGRSDAMVEVFELIRQAAPSTATILIRGESGTGKELIARAVHHNSPRSGDPFVALNAGSIPTDLLESQLFGHVKGAFTGALADKKGLFELANQGTFFLDEVGNISLEIQAKLLRVLQEKEFMPVGSTETVAVDVRLVCATNADLEKMIEDGSFREDLYYRLNVIEVHIPPLRDRSGDLPLLIDYFVDKYEHANNKKIVKIEPDFIAALEKYTWPGNVRELENLIERAIVLARDGVVDSSLLPPSFRQKSERGRDMLPSLDTGINFQEQIQTYERALILQALKKTDNVQKAAAALLGLKTTTFSEMLKRHKLR